MYMGEKKKINIITSANTQKDKDAILTKHGTENMFKHILQKSPPNKKINLHIKFQKIIHRIINSQINFT